MFFKYHGIVQYNIMGQDVPMTNMTKASIVIDNSKNLFQTINVDSRTPEQVADDLYGDPKLYWTILFVNNIIDPFIDWYMMEDQLERYCIRIYGSEENIMKVRYFENTVKNEIINGDEAEQYYQMMEDHILLPEDINYVTNLDYEKMLNENKKSIRIIPPQMITKFVETFKNSLKG